MRGQLNAENVDSAPWVIVTGVTHEIWLAFLSELDPMKLGCVTIFDAWHPKA